jgi:putative ATP-dependent endonuclease of the OLD family
MRITQLSVENYRTLQALKLDFPSFYTAICGRNDSGKTNVVTAVRHLFKQDERYYYRYSDSEKPWFTFAEDFTKWVDVEPKKRSISAEVSLLVDSVRDAGIYAFLVDYLGLTNPPKELEMHFSFTQHPEGEKKTTVQTGGQTYDGLKAEEVHKRFVTSPIFLFHSSMDPEEVYYRGARGGLREISEEHSQRLEVSQKTVNNVIRRITHDQEDKIEAFLGRLNDKYKVKLTCPIFDLSTFPYNITLGDRKIDVDLDDWGSGTRNRTLILMTIFRAKQVADSKVSSAKITPIIVIEEPESYLHPLAQAEFGRVLQDLSQEFEIQIITTTHSPYLLSHTRSDSNILLERHTVRKQLRQTERVDTAGERWMQPFAMSLGLTDDTFKPWRELLFSQPTSVLLVEGDVDRQYFELLQKDEHANNRLCFSEVIFPYGGVSTLRNQALLKFIKDLFGKVFITFDLDGKGEVERSLSSLGFEEKRHYLPIGLEEAGKRKIEGLLPDAIRTKVYAENPNLVDALSGSTEERHSAENRLKKLLLEAFTKSATPGSEDFKKFYEIVRVINKAIKSD